MFRRHRFKRRHLKKTTELSIVRLMMAFGFGAIDAVWALYMNSFGLSESTIGFISAFLVVVSLGTALYSTAVLEKVKEFSILTISMVITIISYLLIAYFRDLYFFIFVSIILTIITVFRAESFGILFRDEAKTKTLNEDEGLMYALLNVGWLIGPLMAGFVLARYGIPVVFIMSAGFIMIGLLVLLSLRIKYKDKKRESIDKNIKDNLKSYIKSKKLRIPYLVASGVEIWWSLIYIYMPLFIIKSGLGEKTVGFFLALVTVPLVILEYEAGYFSEKYGFKPFLVAGFFIMGLAALVSFFVSNIYLIMAVLVVASIGMACVEPLLDSFFFKKVKSKDEEKYYPIFSTSCDVGSFTGKFLIAGVLIILPTNFAYLTIALLMFFIALISLKIKENTKYLNT